jgi:hypothetical protein
MLRRRWSDDLSPDLLREIAACLHVAADFIHFHAVCRPWRNSRSPSDKTAVNQFLPWLLASAGNQHFPPQQGATSVRVASFLLRVAPFYEKGATLVQVAYYSEKGQLISKLQLFFKKCETSVPSCTFLL